MGDDTRPAFKWANDLRVKRQPVEKPARLCEKPGCGSAGDYRAPKSRDALNQYYWFCLDHVREYNLSWDYFRGMSAEQVDAYQRSTMVGHRPTWKLGERSAGPNPRLQHYFEGTFADPLSIIEEGPPRKPDPQRTEGKVQPAKHRSKLQLAALETLHLEPEATMEDVKARFKELVKKFHPDANGGDRGAEERLRHVIKAYSQLRASGYS